MKMVAMNGMSRAPTRWVYILQVSLWTLALGPWGSTTGSTTESLWHMRRRWRSLPRTRPHRIGIVISIDQKG
ncbi:hypothetical protein F4820DRAFT_428114 [Hypoxylon rubiginosum]|uniref:Uncharacterized protein n=1 Tax=Hypoxylon rubiginosum TaxID=110542 RepID=A0ACB9YV94_9PEZI|nr:hypothetical protein F4820DRAFT_428114 [Hypoxylon rubiginosum]